MAQNTIYGTYRGTLMKIPLLNPTYGY